MKIKFLIIITLLSCIGCITSSETDSKGQAVLSGHINYQMFEGVTVAAPIHITVYDSENYNKIYSQHLVRFSDTTFALTGLPEKNTDIVIHGDDIFSNKICDVSLESGEVALSTTVTKKHLTDISSCYIVVEFKDAETDSIKAAKIAGEYECTINGYHIKSSIPRTIWHVQMPECFMHHELIYRFNSDRRVFSAGVRVQFRGDI